MKRRVGRGVSTLTRGPASASLVPSSPLTGTQMERLGTLLFVGVFSLAAACSSGVQRGTVSDKSSFASEFEGAPDWVRVRNCAEPWVKNPDKTICGVASETIRAAHLMDLAYQSAGALASAEIAKQLSKRVESLLETYKAQWTEGVEDAGVSAEAKIDSIVKEVAKLNLSGVKAVDTWISPNNNYYVLQIVDAETAIDTLKKVRSLSERQKALIDEHKTDLLQRLDQAQP